MGCKLVFTSGTIQTLYAGDISQPITIQRQDESGNPATIGAFGQPETPIALSTTSSSGQFSISSSPFTPVTSVTIPFSPGSTSSSMTVYYKDIGIGTVTLTASTDGALPPSTTTTFEILRYTSTAVSPNPASVIMGNTITFTATVTDTSLGTASTPIGSVVWVAGTGTISGRPVTFASCTLSAGSCQVTYTPLSTGTVTISATYQGQNTLDLFHIASGGGTTLTVITATQASQNLINTINSMGLPNGVTTSLSATLKNINLSNIPSACSKLDAFINKVNTDLTNGLLTASQATTLLNAANAIKTSIGC